MAQSICKVRGPGKHAPNGTDSRVVAVLIATLTLLVTATIDCLRITARLVMLVAAALAAVVAALLHTLGLPRVAHHIESLHRHNRVVARNDEFASPRTSLCLVPNEHAQAGAGAQHRREGIPEPPVMALALERHARHVQAAIAYIADRIVRSARQHSFTPPKQSEPVTASLPDGASPET